MAKVVFFGSTEFSVPSLIALHQAGHHLCAVVTQPDRPSGRGMKLQSTPVKRTAEKLDLAIYQPNRCRSKAFIEKINAMEPDFLVTAAFGQLLPNALLDTARSGYALNVHASLLPKYRGAAPIHRAIMDGEEETGVCIMQMVAKIDAGEIYSSVARKILPAYDVRTLEGLLADDGAQLLVKTIEQLMSGGIQPTLQDEALATYAHMIEREDAFIDWKLSAKRIFGQMRAMSPKPGAEFVWNGKGVKLWEAEVLDSPPSQPGCVLSVDKQSIVVACGEGALKVSEVQPEGKARMSVASWVNGARVKTGDLLLSRCEQ